jgi:hypothetical protein
MTNNIKVGKKFLYQNETWTVIKREESTWQPYKEKTHVWACKSERSEWNRFYSGFLSEFIRSYEHKFELFDDDELDF